MNNKPIFLFVLAWSTRLLIDVSGSIIEESAETLSLSTIGDITLMFAILRGGLVSLENMKTNEFY